MSLKECLKTRSARFRFVRLTTAILMGTVTVLLLGTFRTFGEYLWRLLVALLVARFSLASVVWFFKKDILARIHAGERPAGEGEGNAQFTHGFDRGRNSCRDARQRADEGREDLMSNVVGGEP